MGDLCSLDSRQYPITAAGKVPISRSSLFLAPNGCGTAFAKLDIVLHNQRTAMFEG
jgi:hypothetical protein